MSSAPALLLRPPAAADYAAIASWITDAEACARWAGPVLPFPFPETGLGALLDIPGGASYVLGDGAGATLGFGQYRVDRPGAAHLCRIIVAPDGRGRGWGRVLCTLLMAQAARDTGATSITLKVYRDNGAALALYRGLGFQVLEAQSDAEVWFMRAPVSCSTPM